VDGVPLEFRRVDALLAPRSSLLDGEELVNIVPNDLRRKAAPTMVAGEIKPAAFAYRIMAGYTEGTSHSYFYCRPIIMRSSFD
jgi:hypothetical protein